MKPPTFSPLYVVCFPALAEVARAHGYALMVHGTVARDLDLVACPWTESPGPSLWAAPRSSTSR